MQSSETKTNRRELLSLALAGAATSMLDVAWCRAQDDDSELDDLEDELAPRVRLPQERLDVVLSDYYPIGRTTDGDLMVTRYSTQKLRGENPSQSLATSTRRLAIVFNGEALPKWIENLREDLALIVDQISRIISKREKKIDLHIEFIAIPPASGPQVDARFPPQGGFYDHPSDPQARYLWNWLGCEGFDVVFELAFGKKRNLGANDLAKAAFKIQKESTSIAPPKGSLTEALGTTKAAGVGTIPALYIEGDVLSIPKGIVDILLGFFEKTGTIPNSAAHDVLIRRAERSAADINQILSKTYDKKLTSLSYISSLIALGRLNAMGLALEAENALQLLAEVRELAKEAATNPPKSGPEAAGLLLFGVVYMTFDFDAFKIEGDRELYMQALRKGTDQVFDSEGSPLPIAPHSYEMSDSIFMWCPLLIVMYRITNEERYLTAAMNHARAMQKLCLREDGLYRHSPRCEAAWGRGNGFAALGLTMCADFLTGESEQRTFFNEQAMTIVDQLTERSLDSHTPGMLTQVIDEPSSYREFSSSAMVAICAGSMLANKFVDENRRPQFQAFFDAAVDQLSRRMSDDGTFVDVCVGTSKMATLQEYLDRPATTGRDDRGAAMMLLLQLQILSLQKIDAKPATPAE